MIRTTHAEIEMLRRGATRVIIIPKTTPRSGAPKARCRWTQGRDYEVMAPATLTPDNKVDKPEERLRCIAHSVVDAGDGWALTLRVGVVERPRFLRATPGAVAITKLPDGRMSTEGDGDYTELRKSAIPDEPEPVDEATHKRFADAARDAESYRRVYDTRQERDLLRVTIDDLASRTDLGELAGRRLARMRRDLQRLERELRA